MKPITHNIKPKTIFDADLVKKPADTSIESNFVMEDKIPSNWVITPLGDNKIKAVNSRTIQTFEGSMKDFNKALRA